MAGPYDIFPQRTPIRPNQELASMQGLLTALAERRMQQQVAEQERARRAYEFSMLQANREEDNRREAQRISMQDKLMRDQMAQTKELADQKALSEMDRAAAAAWESKVQPALASDAVDQAQASAQAAGIPLRQKTIPGATVTRTVDPLLGLRELPVPGMAALPPASETVQEQGPSRTVWQAPMPAGRLLEYDAEEARRVRQQRAAAAADEFERNMGPLLRKHRYGELALAPVLQRMRSSETWDPKEDPYKEVMKRITDLENQEIARIAPSRGPDPGGFKTADDRARDAAQFDASAKRWEQAAGVDRLTDDHTTFLNLTASVKAFGQTGNTIDQRNALYRAARLITGPGVLTAQEYANTVTNTKGWYEGLKTKLEKGLTGEISDAEWNTLSQFVDNANAAIRKRGIAAVKNFDTRFGPKSQAGKMVPDEVGVYRGSILRRFGLTEADLGLSAEDEERLRAIESRRGR